MDFPVPARPVTKMSLPPKVDSWICWRAACCSGLRVGSPGRIEVDIDLKFLP